MVVNVEDLRVGPVGAYEHVLVALAGVVFDALFDDGLVKAALDGDLGADDGPQLLPVAAEDQFGGRAGHLHRDEGFHEVALPGLVDHDLVQAVLLQVRLPQAEQ